MNNKGLRRIAMIGGGAVLAGAALSGIIFGYTASVLFLLMGALILCVFLYYTRQRYRELEEINVFFSKVLMGDYDLDIEKNEEGELSILQNNIYKATVQLREKNELLEEEKRFLVDMLANISHQLKTPLTSMMMMNELLAHEESEEKRREFVEIEEKQLEKMNWLIQTLLKLSKLDAGAIVLKEEEVHVEKLISESLSPFLIRMDVEEIVLDQRLREATLRIDESWTVEAVRNIVKNCIEHMGKGGKLIIENAENPLYHTIWIKDTGCGISEEDLPHIFERFYRGQNASKESVGIGLALSKSILGKERGEILVTSETGRGTCFELRFYKTII